ncbi:MAG TPA: PspA/IM30 family protein [Chloroflexota bacterium]|jgi:phage shock protein A
MGLFDRMRTILGAKANTLMDQAENPSETLDYSYEKLVELLQKVQRGIVDEVTAKHRLTQQANQLRGQTAQLDAQAKQAVTAGRDDLARIALQRKQAIVEQVGGLDQQIADLEAEQQRLTTAEMNLRTKVEAFRTRKEVIKAQHSSAEAEVRIGEALGGVSEEMASVGLSVERAEQKTSQLRARASALDELSKAGLLTDATGGHSDDVSTQLAQLTASQNVESELAALKQSATPKQLGSGK